MCVRHTAADAFFRGYHIVIAEDGVEAFTDEDQEQGLKYLEYVYNAKIMMINDIIREIVSKFKKPLLTISKLHFAVLSFKIITSIVIR